MMLQSYEKYMQRCIDLARNGKGNVAPNPMVGSVIVYEDKIIGEGYHRHFGGPHAEVNAINSVINPDLLIDSTLFVTLEPCTHTGKTPPCSDLIISKKIKKIVIGTMDPNSVVAGKGIERLRNAGAEVITGILEDECRELNKRFFTFHLHKRPYIILKWAQSPDGLIDIIRQPTTPIGPNWISNPVSRILVHKWRAVEQAIMIGTNTVIYDNPKLNTRYWPGSSPVRIILDRQGRIPYGANVFDGSVKTLVFTEADKTSKPNLEFIQTDFTKDTLLQVLTYLYEHNIQSLMVEGGKKLIQSFIDKGLWDEARVFKGHVPFIDGVKAPQIKALVKSTKIILNDTLTIYSKNL
jgi:diaminohydroxyphosphoribosylaminopyrimidine deaminase / 5-amino-6-(5-phosphoribosylamino)uracil reductase